MPGQESHQQARLSAGSIQARPRAQERAIRHRAILIAVGIAISSLGCSQGRGDTSPAPPIPAVAPPELPAGAPLEKTYRVPVDGLPSIGDTRALVPIVAFRSEKRRVG